MKANLQRRRRNPDPDEAVIYDEVESITAKKGDQSGYPGQTFEHVFKSKPKLIGLANGDLLITTGESKNPRLRKGAKPHRKKRRTK